MTLLAAGAPARLSAPVVWETAVARWLLFAGLSMALGGLAGRGLARQYKGRFPVPLPTPWALRGSVLGAAASAWLALIALSGAGLVTGLAHAPRLFSATPGATAGVELISFAVAALLLRLRQPRWSVLPLVVVVAAEGLRAHPETIAPVVGALITYCHLLPAALWAGMLLYILRAAIAWRDYPDEMRGLVRLYAAAAAWLFAFLVITGVISALVLVPLGSLPTTAYGRVLLVKAALVLAAGCLAHAPRLFSATPGATAGVELISFAVAALLLRLRQPRWSVLPLVVVVAAEGLRAHPETIAPVVGALITYCHLLPAALWAGMLLYILRAAIAWREYPDEMRGLVRLYAAAAAWLFAFLVITGVISALVLVPLGSLPTTAYGRVLLVKAALVLAAGCLAVAGRVWLRHRPEPGTGPALATRLECATLAVVLAVTALLTALTPPATPIKPAAAVQQHLAGR